MESPLKRKCDSAPCLKDLALLREFTARRGYLQERRERERACLLGPQEGQILAAMEAG